MISKWAIEIEPGDILFDHSSGERVGMTLNVYRYQGYPSVEIDVLTDEGERRLRLMSGELFSVRPWFPSQAV